MNTYDEIMKAYLETMSKAPKECQECTKRHFIGCSGCEYSNEHGDKWLRKPEHGEVMP